MSFWTQLRQTPFWTYLKWSMMLAALFWVLVYTLSQHSPQLPGFVYVNF